MAVWLGHARSDNVARGAEGSGRGSYNALGTSFNLQHDRGRLEAGLVGNLEYRSYNDDVVPNEHVGNLAATADIDIVQDRFAWLFGESYVQGRSDPFGADTPENRENVSVFATGPEIMLPLGGRTSLGLAGTYSERSYGTSTFLDSEVLERELGLYRQVRQTTVVGIAIESTEVEYQSTTLGYDIDSAYFSYERTLAQGSVDFNVGRNELVTDLRTVSEPLFEFNWERALAARSTLTVSAVSGFTDSGRLLELRPDQVAIDVLLSTDATNRQNVALEYEVDLTRMSVIAGVGALRDEFQQSTALDSDGTEVHFQVLRPISQLTTVGATLMRVERKFTESGTSNQESFARFWVNRRFGQSFSLEAHVQRSEHPGIYTERLYQVTLVFVPGGRRDEAGRARGGGRGRT